MADQPNTLPVNQLQPNPFQPRDKIKKEDIAELVESVKSYGVIEPLVVAHTPAGYQIIAGERRWRAAKAAGLEEVPVSIKKTSPKQMLELALVENVQRKDLNAIERAKGFQQLIREFSFSVKGLAQKIGKSSSYVSNSLRLLDLPDAVKDGLINEKISEGHARALAGLEDEHTLINCYRQIVKEDASVRRAEQLVRQIKQKEEEEDVKQKVKKSAQKDKRVVSLRQRLATKFSNPTDVNLTRSRKQTRVTITLKGSLADTEHDLKELMQMLQS
jgi:ParB family chromosome partitioning protein